MLYSADMGDSPALDRLARALWTSGLAGLAAGFLEAAGPQLAVETGRRLHISLGSGGIGGPETPATLAGLTILQRLARVAGLPAQSPREASPSPG